MSTAPAGTPSDPQQRPSHQPGSLAILTATAVGGVLASRLGKAPLVLAAAAAAIALLRQKRPVAPPVPPQDLPLLEPPQIESPALSQVEQWLSQQISREEQAPVLEFSTLSAPPPEPEDDYRPQPFLLDDAEESTPHVPADDSCAQLAAPMAWHIPVPPSEVPAAVVPPQLAPMEWHTPTPAPQPEIETEAAPAQPSPMAWHISAPPPEMEIETQPFPPLYPSPVAAYSAPAPEDAAWTLGVEPLPSLGEAAPSPTLASSMFFAAPVQQEELDSPPVISSSAPIFEGAAFPDEINVVPAIEPVVHLLPPAPEVQAPQWSPPEPEAIQEPELPAAVDTSADSPPEIDVHLAAPGEASFDPPLAAAPQNPWEPEPEREAEAPPVPYVSPFYSHMTSPVVEAEIILRPRAPTQNTVTTKTKPIPHAPIKKDFAESFDTPSVEDLSEALFPSPPQSPPEPRTRPSWRSWWRGD